MVKAAEHIKEEEKFIVARKNIRGKISQASKSVVEHIKEEENFTVARNKIWGKITQASKSVKTFYRRDLCGEWSVCR